MGHRTPKGYTVDSFTSVVVDGGDFPDVSLNDGDTSDHVALIFRAKPDAAAKLYLVWQAGDTDDATQAGFQFALWLEQVAEAVRDRAFNRRTRDDLERDDAFMAMAAARDEQAEQADAGAGAF